MSQYSWIRADSIRAALVLSASLSGFACSSTSDGGATPDAGPAVERCASTTTVTFTPGQENELQDAVNELAACTTVKLGAGTFHLSNAITIRAKGITIEGAGKGTKGEATGGASSTVLDFSGAAANTNGVDVVGDLFAIRDVAIWNAQKDAVRIESSANVAIQRVRTEWATENAETNGKYGLYPVKSTNVLMEDCEAYNAADAGIYVGQTQYAIVRNNIAKQNVAGIEIENTRFADVYNNVAEDNTTGLVVFDLPGNPIKGTDVALHHNTIVNNNRQNFASVSASSSTVSQVPAGTGTFIMASRRVEIAHNTYENNDSVDIAVLSGLAIEADQSKWVAGGNNWGSADIWVHDNTIKGGSGDDVDAGHTNAELRPLGAALAGLYMYGRLSGSATGVETLLWDGIDLTAQDNATNDINLCMGANTWPEGTTNVVVDLNLVATQPLLMQDPPDIETAWGKTFHYAANVAPFNCSGFTPALTAVKLP